MEEDKRKKKRNKKKNKQATKLKECTTVDTTESTSDNQSYVSEMGPDNNSQVLELQGLQNEVEGKIDIDVDRTLANGTEGTTLAGCEEQYWLHREVSLQKKIELQTGKDAIPHKEAILEEKIKQLLEERDENLQKEASQEEKITQLQSEKNECLQKENNLEEKVKQLQEDNDAYLQKHADLEHKIQLLEREKDLWLNKEVGFEEKISQLENEVAVLNLKGVSLDEMIKDMEKERDLWSEKQDSLEDKIKLLQKFKDAYTEKEAELERKTKQIEIEKDLWLKKEVDFGEKIEQLENEVAILNLNGVSLDKRIKHMKQEREIWVQKQNSTDEAFSTLEDNNARLQAEVLELKELRRRSLLQENHLLTENISSLQSDVKKLESSAAVSDLSLKNNVLTSENEDAEKAKLVGKVNESSEQMGENTDVSLSVGYVVNTSFLALKPTVATDSTTSEVGKLRIVSRDSIESLEDVIITEPRNGEHLESDEIVQIPLDESKVMAASAGQNDDVPLTEAPLIGAPFRLISFVARYVSGADLVNKNSDGSVS